MVAYGTRREKRFAEESSRRGKRAASLPEPENRSDLLKFIELEKERTSKSSRKRARITEPIQNASHTSEKKNEEKSKSKTSKSLELSTSKRANSHRKNVEDDGLHGRIESNLKKNSQRDESSKSDGLDSWIQDPSSEEEKSLSKSEVKDSPQEDLEKENSSNFHEDTEKLSIVDGENERFESIEGETSVNLSDQDSVGESHEVPLWRRAFILIGSISLYSLLILVGFAFVSNFVIGLPLKPVVSDSMNPYLNKGDLIVVAEKNYNSIGVGDVITYEADWLDGDTVVHRVIDISDNQVITKGDNNSVSDPPFSPDKVRGEMVAKIPNAGYLFNYRTIIILGVLSNLLILTGYGVFDRFFKKSRKVGEEGDSSTLKVSE